jgi:hypothetical protein
MARRPRGKEVLALAQQQLVKTSAANELRILQAAWRMDSLPWKRW